MMIPSLRTLEEEYERIRQEAKLDVDRLSSKDNTKDISVNIMIREGDMKSEVLKIIEEKNIDLAIMVAHEENRIEHFLYCEGVEEMIRKMPCSIVMVREEPIPARQYAKERKYNRISA
jgi:universal stress protein A